MAKTEDPKKNMTAVEKERWDKQHDFDSIVTLYSGGEHLRAASLAAEAKFSQSKLDDLAVLCPGIIDHMPADPGDTRQKGSVPGNPTETEMSKFQTDESEVSDLAQQHKEAHDPKAALAKREPAQSGHPDNTGIDGPTLHPGTSNADKDDVKK